MKAKFLLSAAICMFLCGQAGADATWRGGSGDWLSPNWNGATGAGGFPGAGDRVVLPLSTGTVSLSADLIGAFGTFGPLSQSGGTLDIGPLGRASFNGARLGDGFNAHGTLNVAGELNVFGGFDVAYGTGGGGSSLGTLNISGSARVRISGNLDTWWDPGAQMSVTGPSADIEISQTFFVGTGATFTANITADSHSPVGVLGTASIQGGTSTLVVNFTEGYIPTPGASWIIIDAATRTGTFVNVQLPDTGTGTVLSLDYRSGGSRGQIVAVDFTNTLNLRVDTVNGTVAIENPFPGGDAYNIDGYLIQSASGALTPEGFQGIGEDGWLPGLPPSQNESVISETNFDGAMLIDNATSLDIGDLFDPQGAQDLTFEFHVLGGRTVAGTVEFFEGSRLVGDANGDDIVNRGDISIVVGNLGTSGASISDGDFNRDRLVSLTDVALLQVNFGATVGGSPVAGSPIAVPEPSALFIVALGLLSLSVARRRSVGRLC